MPTTKIKITYTEDDLKKLLAEKASVVPETAMIIIRSVEPDRGGVPYSEITIEGEPYHYPTT